ncbi:hypothetical protein ABC255_09605 [Neobacillus sp. 3P2-tot-E-2]|uniref:hypothetical protein n=1 Tax=Neobacillus sp. 3P2-tot-E-2 TaxID=3132212 RepID=UPI0039A09F5B
MAKVIKLFNKQEQDREALVKHIEDFLEMAKNGELKNIMVAAEHIDNDILTGYCNLDVQEKQYMIGHFQADVTMAIVEANIDRLIEFI